MSFVKEVFPTLEVGHVQDLYDYISVFKIEKVSDTKVRVISSHADGYTSNHLSGTIQAVTLFKDLMTLDEISSTL